MTYLFAAFMACLFWGGYALGWRGAKQETRAFALIDRLYELAKLGLASNKEGHKGQ